MSILNNKQVSLGKLLLFFSGTMYELVISNKISLLYDLNSKKLELCRLNEDTINYSLTYHSTDNLYNVYDC